MQLLTEELKQLLPPLYASVGQDDPLVLVKFFTPDADWTWYVVEGSPVDEDGYFDTDKEKVGFLFFGLVVGQDSEIGYFSLAELESVRGKLGLPVERDLWFTPVRLSEVIQAQER